MPLVSSENEREPWSRITDSSLLRPRDELRLIGKNFIATIGVLDAHDPSAETDLSLGQVIGLESPPLPNHHHALVRIEGQPDVLSTGLLVGEGEPEDLFFPHITHLQAEDKTYIELMGRFYAVMELGNFGLYFASPEEQLSTTREGQAYLDDRGRLFR